jgi:N-acetylmuramoyl-L-alanine amidase
MRTFLLAGLLLATVVLVGLAWSTKQVPTSSSAGLSPTINSSWQTALKHLHSPVRIGIQVGHEKTLDHPDELARLRYSTGGYANSVSEVDINREIAEALEGRLEALGIVVDLLPATVPPHYRADLVIALHADSNRDPARRGYKSAHFRDPRNRLEPVLKQHLDEAYLELSGLPHDEENVSGAMLEYYAFNHKKYRHAVSHRTPAVIVEMGYISNVDDLKVLTSEKPATAIAEGVVSFLRDRGRL